MPSKPPTPLGTLPAELLSIVLSELAAHPGPSDHGSGRAALAALMSTSRAMHDLVGPILYSRIVLTRNNADALFFGLPRSRGKRKTRRVFASKEERARARRRFDELLDQPVAGDSDHSEVGQPPDVVDAAESEDELDSQASDEEVDPQAAALQRLATAYWRGHTLSLPVGGRSSKVDSDDEYESLSETDDELPAGRYLGEDGGADDEDDRDTVGPAAGKRRRAYFPLEAEASSARKLRLLRHCRALHIVQIPNQNLLEDARSWGEAHRPFPNVEHVMFSSRAVLAAVKLYNHRQAEWLKIPDDDFLTRIFDGVDIFGDGVTNTCVVLCPPRKHTRADIFHSVPQPCDLGPSVLRDIMASDLFSTDDTYWTSVKEWWPDYWLRGNGNNHCVNATFHGLEERGLPDLLSELWGTSSKRSGRVRIFQPAGVVPGDGDGNDEDDGNDDDEDDDEEVDEDEIGRVVSGLRFLLYLTPPNHHTAVQTYEYIADTGPNVRALSKAMDAAASDLPKHNLPEEHKAIWDRASWDLYNRMHHRAWYIWYMHRDDNDPPNMPMEGWRQEVAKWEELAEKARGLAESRSAAMRERHERRFPTARERLTITPLKDAAPCVSCGQKRVVEAESLAELIAATERIPLLVGRGYVC